VARRAEAEVTVLLAWVLITWLDTALVPSLLALGLAFAYLVWREGMRRVPWRAMAALGALVLVAHLLAPGALALRLTQAASMALRLWAVLCEGQAVLGIVGPIGLARTLGRLGVLLRPLGVRQRDLEVMAFVTLRMIPETARSARSIWLGRRFLAGRAGMGHWTALAGAWVAQSMRTAGAVGEALVLRGFGPRQALPRVDWRGLALGWLPLATLALALPWWLR
jgi:energy-coupling factor transporter transmembrane protein EcfT